VGDEVPVDDVFRLVVTKLDGRRVARVALLSALPTARAATD
jgi:hypothetical protein